MSRPSRTLGAADAALLVLALALLSAFVTINAARVPVDAPLVYDEATHVQEAWVFRDAMAAGDGARLYELVGERKIGKGILFRLYLGAAYLIGPDAGSTARYAGLAAFVGAALVILAFAWQSAPPDRRALAGFFALAFLLLAPLIHKYARSAFVEPLNLFTVILALAAWVHDRRRRSPGSLALSAAAWIVAFITKFNHGVILVMAVAADGLIESWRERKTRGFRSHLRTFAPLLVAACPLVAWMLGGRRLSAFLFYIVHNTERRTFDPTGLVYVETFARKAAPWAIGTLLLVVAFAAGLRRVREPAVRVLSLHIAIGLALAQMNALKIDRIMVPLFGGVAVVAGLGAADLVGRLLPRAKAGALAAAALLALALFVGPRTELLRVEPHPLRPLAVLVDEAVELARGARRPLFVGACRYRGLAVANAHSIHIRAVERGIDFDRGGFEFAGEEFLSKRLRSVGLNLGDLRRGSVGHVELRKILVPYDRIIVLVDPAPVRPQLIDPWDRALVRALESLPEWRPEKPYRYELDLEPGRRPLRAEIVRYLRR